MIKLIIFDWDDVFTLGSTKGYFKAYHETLVKLGISLPPVEEEKRIRAKWGKTAREELAELFQEDLSQLDEACKIYEKVLFSNVFVDELEIVSGTADLLERLHKQYTLAIATGVNPDLLRKKILPKFNIPNVFAQIISVYDLEDSAMAKPHPYMIEQILKTQKIPANQSIFVGDAKTDIQMARSAGIIAVAVLTGHLTREEAETLKVPYIIDDVTRIEEVLVKLN